MNFRNYNLNSVIDVRRRHMVREPDLERLNSIGDEVGTVPT
jgi:hypothetical protein